VQLGADVMAAGLQSGDCGRVGAGSCTRWEQPKQPAVVGIDGVHARGAMLEPDARESACRSVVIEQNDERLVGRLYLSVR
jgi:hypothetical protein